MSAERWPWAFTLIYTAPTCPMACDAWVEALGAAGSTDLLVGAGRPGRLALTAEREGTRLAEAIGHTVLEVNRAWPQAMLCAIHPGSALDAPGRHGTPRARTGVRPHGD